MLGTQPVDCCQHVVSIRREVGVGELPLAVTEPSEVKPEHTEPGVSQGGRDPRCCLDVFTASEAVGKQSKSPGRPRWQVDSGGEFGVLTAGESDSFNSCGHNANLTLTTAQRSPLVQPHVHPVRGDTSEGSPLPSRQMVALTLTGLRR
jgi:hypothetical protein